MSKTVIKEFLNRSSDDEIRFLGMRLVERLQDDLAEVFNYVSKGNSRNIGLDDLFKSTTTANELYQYCDDLQQEIEKEASKRNVSLSRGKPS